MGQQSNLGKLLQWTESLEYRDIRLAESVQTVEVMVGSGSNRKPLRGVNVAPDLVLGRDRQFYKILDGHAAVLPVSQVVEQYNVQDLINGYGRARRRQPRSRK